MEGTTNKRLWKFRWYEQLDSFLKDADLDGRSFNTVMREVQMNASIYGNCWVVVDKPQSNAKTRAEELAQDIRPYISIYTPENVVNWNYARSASGRFYLDMLVVSRGYKRR